MLGCCSCRGRFSFWCCLLGACAAGVSAFLPPTVDGSKSNKPNAFESSFVDVVSVKFSNNWWRKGERKRPVEPRGWQIVEIFEADLIESFSFCFKACSCKRKCFFLSWKSKGFFLSSGGTSLLLFHHPLCSGFPKRCNSPATWYGDRQSGPGTITASWNATPKTTCQQTNYSICISEYSRT